MSIVTDEALWEQDEQWQRWKTALRGFPGKLQLLELCGGTGAAYIALSKLLPAGTLQLAGHWDTDDELADILQRVHAECSNIHLGSIAGDILATDVENFPNCHAIVAGPPCPPWSKLGKKESFGDKRAAVLWRVIDIVTHQADSLRGSSVKVGTMQRRLARPLRKDDAHKSRSVNISFGTSSLDNFIQIQIEGLIDDLVSLSAEKGHTLWAIL